MTHLRNSLRMYRMAFTVFEKVQKYEAEVTEEERREADRKDLFVPHSTAIEVRIYLLRFDH